MPKSQRLSFWYVIPPTITLILILPPISELPPFLSKGTENPNISQALLALPFYLGLTAAPGYIYAWLGNYNSKSLRRGVRLWVYVSLIIAVVASFVGGLLSILTVIVAPFAFWSFIMVVKLLLKFHGGHQK